MTNIDTRSARHHAIERQAQRLERRLIPLGILSNRVSWLRVAIVVIGIISTYIVGSLLNELMGWSTLVATVLLYAIAVVYHRHIERWVRIFTISRDMRFDQLARMDLNWEKLPGPAPLDRRYENALAIDLDLIGEHSLHRLLDTTISRQGSQRLAGWLTHTIPDPEQIHARQRLVRELLSLSRSRDRFRLTFRLVLEEQLEGENLSHWLAIAFPSRRLKRALPIAAALVAANIILFALFLLGGLPAYWLITLALYVAFYFFNLASLSTVLQALTRLDSELDRFSAILKYLEAHSFRQTKNLARLCAPLQDPRSSPSLYLRKIRLATAGVGFRSNPVLGLLLNSVLPWDFFFAYLADRYRTQMAAVFPVWLEICYELDALIALANFAYLNPDDVFPEIALDATPILQAENLGHPLIPGHRRVRNDFTIQSRGELDIITGSNMAGKSTFLRTIGTNLCLAYAGAPVAATRLRSAPFRLFTCIRVSDSLADGFSYFYAEVRCLKRLLEELNSDASLPLLYLIDEIFRATNNRERLIGTRAYVHALLRSSGVGLMATHDLELASLANENPQAHNYHFRDQVLDGRLVFDYQIRPGPCPTTNALKIMAVEGLPVNPE